MPKLWRWVVDGGTSLPFYRTTSCSEILQAGDGESLVGRLSLQLGPTRVFSNVGRVGNLLFM